MRRLILVNLSYFMFHFAACNCMLVNTVNGNSSICDEVTGQCSCRANIGGRQCDRCAENAVNTTYAGCQSKSTLAPSPWRLKIIALRIIDTICGPSLVL